MIIIMHLEYKKIKIKRIDDALMINNPIKEAI